MILFITGVCINCIAIALIILNSIRDSLSYRQVTGHNNVLHISGLVLAGVVAAAFYHNNNGNPGIAQLIVWLPAIPMLLATLFMVAVMLLKPNWK